MKADVVQPFPKTNARGVPWWAFSLVVPGWGQMCQCRVWTGLLWLAATIAASCLWSYRMAGVWLHVLCVLDAFGARNNPIVRYGQAGAGQANASRQG